MEPENSAAFFYILANDTVLLLEKRSKIELELAIYCLTMSL